MIRLRKKDKEGNVVGEKIIVNRRVGTTNTDEMGDCISIKLDEYQLLLSHEDCAVLVAKLHVELNKPKKEQKEEKFMESVLPLGTGEGVLTREQE